jgi:ribosomal protein S18 acetylase RimI-like enzyme
VNVVGEAFSAVTDVGTIRPLRRTDRQLLETLLTETAVFSPEEVKIALELIDIVLDQPGQKDYVVWAHETAGIVDGYYCLGPTPATRGTFDLYWIAVAPSRQGKGIGRALSRHAEDLSRSLGGRLLIAETSSRPDYAPTRRFYRNAGYTELSKIRDYYKEGDDLVVYGKYLTHHHEGG